MRAIALVGLLLTLVGCSASSRPPGADQADVVKSRLLSLAAENGEPNPTDGAMVASTRSAANDLVGRGTVVDSNPDVYLAVARGTFTAVDVPRPPMADDPTGPILIAIYDSSSGTLLDWGIAPSYPDLAKLGPVQALF